MDKASKNNEIAELKEKFADCNFFYICDSSSLTVEKINNFRRLCFSKGLEYRVAKNTLIQKALEQLDGNYTPMFETLKGSTGIIFSKEGSVPAKVLKEFREKNDKPLLKGAYIDGDAFIGDNQIEVLSKLKSKAELIGEIIGLLQSPMKNVIGGLQGSAGQKIAGLVKALEERGN
ncbi:MAG: 50S ribosomal protein L10 [Chitinophagales bacterium]